MRQLLKSCIFIVNFRKIRILILTLFLIIFYIAVSNKTAITEDNLTANPNILGCPTLIICDTNSLEPIVPLSYISYQGRLGNFAFLEHLNEKTLMTIINSHKQESISDVLFINSSFEDLPIGLAAIEALNKKKNLNLNNHDPMLVKMTNNSDRVVQVEDAGIYEIWVKKLNIQDGGIIINIEVDGNPFGELKWNRENRKWVKLGNKEFKAGEHKIAAYIRHSSPNSQENEALKKLVGDIEIVILTEGKRKGYEELLNGKRSSYLFYLDEKKIKDALILNPQLSKYIKLNGEIQFRMGEQQFYLQGNGNYTVNALIKPKRNFIISDFVNSGSGSVTASLDAISGWDIKTLIAEYKENISEDGMHIDAYFQYQGDKKEAVILTKKFSDINIKERPYLAFSCEIEDMGVQEVEIIVNFIDTSSWFLKNKKLVLRIDNRQYVVNVYDKAKAVFGREKVKDLQMDEVVLKFKKRDGVDVSNRENKRYRFIFKNIAFLKTEPILAMFDDRIKSTYLPMVYYYFDKNGYLNNVDFPEQVPWDIKDVYKLHSKGFIDLKDAPVLPLSFFKPEIVSKEDLREFPNNWKVIMGIDLDGDEKEDEKIEMLTPAAGLVDGKLLLNINAYEEVNKRFPNKKYYNLLSIGVSRPNDKEIFYQTVMSKKLIRYREHVYKPSDFNVGDDVLDIDDKTYKLPLKARGKELMAKGEDNNWIEFNNIYLKNGKHRLNVLENDKFKVEMVEIKPEPKGEKREVISEKLKIEFKKINPTRYIVDVKNAKGPFTLTFSESFHEEWKAYVRQGQGTMVKGQGEEPWSALWSAWKEKDDRIEIKDHFVVNGFANGWIVPVGQFRVPSSGLRVKDAQEFQIVLEFKPQRLFELGLLISTATLIGCIGYLGYTWIRKKIHINFLDEKNNKNDR